MARSGRFFMSYEDGEESFGSNVSYLPEADEEDDDRLRVSDVAKLARRTRRRVVRAARCDDRPTFVKLLTEHLRTLDRLQGTAEAQPGYQHAELPDALAA